MTNDEREKVLGTKRGDISVRRTRMTRRHLRGARFFMRSSLASVIAAASVAPGCGKPPCEETLTCPRTGDNGGDDGDDTAASAGKSMAGAGGTAAPSGGMPSTGGGGAALSGPTAGGLGGKDGMMNGAGEAGAFPLEQCQTENDCTGSCRTCMDGACVTVKDADDPDSCAGTCDAKGTCKTKRGQTCGISGNGCIAGSVCTDGYCCDTECGEACEACDVSGFEGTCTAVKSGAPHGNRSACGGIGMCAGSCSGRSDGKCDYPTSNCGSGPTCSGTDSVGQAKCSEGECVTPAAKSCDTGFACVGTACKDSCGSDADCDTSHFCQGGKCHLDAVGIAVGAECSMAILADGSIYAWGYNSNGVLGPQGPALVQGAGEPIQNSPIPVTGLPSRAKAVVIGDNHVCALLMTDEVWCWGNNNGGQLGQGEITSNYNDTPAKVAGLPSGITSLAAGASATCALVGSSGEAYCWGTSFYGVLGTNVSGSASAVPVKVAGLSNATQIALSNHACAIVGATLYCWGANGHAQCGQSATTAQIVSPTSFGFGRNGEPQQVGAGGSHSCALLTGGDVHCWGWNLYGCLGDPNTTLDASVWQFVQVADLGEAIQIAIGASSNCAILTNGTVRCWGSQQYGALGDGNIDANDYSVKPVEVIGVANASMISMSTHTCALIGNGSIKCWGSGGLGQLGNSQSSNSAVAVDVTANW